MKENPKLNTLAAAILAALATLGGCAQLPKTYPTPGPNQRTASVIANPNCLAFCDFAGAQTAADNNAAPVTFGDTAQSQSTSASAEASRNTEAYGNTIKKAPEKTGAEVEPKPD